MRGFGVFLAKELREIARTWRIWVLPGIVLFFAASGPPLAKVTPQLLSSLVDTQGDGCRRPTSRSHLCGCLPAVDEEPLADRDIRAHHHVCGGRYRPRSAAAPRFSRSPSLCHDLRSCWARSCPDTVLLVVTTVVGAAVTWALTLAVFSEAPLGPLAAATGVWLLHGLLFVSLMMLLSAALDSQAGAAGVRARRLPRALDRDDLEAGGHVLSGRTRECADRTRDVRSGLARLADRDDDRAHNRTRVRRGRGVQKA